MEEEILVKAKEYFDLIQNNNSIKRIKIDIGLSYNAPQSQTWLEKNNDLAVIGFEPNPESVKSILSKNIVKKHPLHGTPIKNEFIGSKFFLIPVALGNVKEKKFLDFYCMQNDCGTSSLLKPNIDYLEEIKTKIEVPVFSLKHFFDIFPWNKFDYIEYIKTDAQGSDLDILMGAGDYLKEKVVYITSEAESTHYEGSFFNNESNMTSFLKSQNFVRVFHPNTKDPTYINEKFFHLKNEIFIYQNG